MMDEDNIAEPEEDPKNHSSDPNFVARNQHGRNIEKDSGLHAEGKVGRVDADGRLKQLPRRASWKAFEGFGQQEGMPRTGASEDYNSWHRECTLLFAQTRGAEFVYG